MKSGKRVRKRHSADDDDNDNGIGEMVKIAFASAAVWRVNCPHAAFGSLGMLFLKIKK